MKLVQIILFPPVGLLWSMVVVFYCTGDLLWGTLTVAEILIRLKFNLTA